MKLFYFTFGQRFRHDLHPQGGHPDGWFTVAAEDSHKARLKMIDACGAAWAMQYEQEPSRQLFPLGELPFCLC